MPLLTVSQVAKSRGVSIQRVHQYVADGRLPNRSPDPGSLILIDSRDLAKLVVAKRGRPKSAKPTTVRR